MVKTIDMPAVGGGYHGQDNSAASSLPKSISGSGSSSNNASMGANMQRKESWDSPTPAIEKLPGGWPQTPLGLVTATVKEGAGGQNGSVLSVPNGRTGSERASSAKSVALSSRTRRSSNLDGERRSGEVASGPIASTPSHTLPPLQETSPAQSPKHASTLPPDGTLKQPAHQPHPHRASSPPAFSHTPASPPVSSGAASPPQARPDRLVQRHTLEVPKVSTARISTESKDPTSPSLDTAVVSATGRFSPTAPTRRRGSLQLARRVTRSIHSHIDTDMQLDQVHQDEEAAKWAEVIRAKRASRKNHRVDTDDDRVVVGTKVDEHHQNYVRAYNMLTGIRFCVSRIHAKEDRELNEGDFRAAQKYSFDITGNELTPSTKYDFKFKDYAPWVFRHIRTVFGIDPAEYLVSLTAKYILSELGSPGKSGSFFYFSRDYKYIIKTIHHGEHKFLRKILRDYYGHVRDNSNTLLSQFYGLHRVKLPYGKKVHFVIMNNLFPPHRDIHRTFDLKGSTIGRDFREEDLEKNPRATLKDLNWLRRNLHLEFGPTKKEVFVRQMQRDVALLQRLKIMDYSLLVGIHDLERGNEENLRDQTLKVFQPSVEKRGEESLQPQMGQLARTPSKLESAKRARELRETVKKERPVPMAQTLDKMPDESHRKGFYFYADDGGFQATHEDDSPGDEIYYLGIIDCLTRYNYVKKAEHVWKGMGGHESQISPIPPDRYGDRFIKFISGITMSREQAEKVGSSQMLEPTAGMKHLSGIEGTLNDPQLGGVNIQKDPRNPKGTEKVMEKAERQLERVRRHGGNEEEVPDRSITVIRSAGDGAEAATLPVIGEAAEAASNASRTPSKLTPSHSREEVVVGNANMPPDSLGAVPPPTPPKTDESSDAKHAKDRFSVEEHNDAVRRTSASLHGVPPPTPPKDVGYVGGRGRSGLDQQELPLPPVATKVFSASPSRMVEQEMEKARQSVKGQ